jgi:hypothetical protein
MTQRNWLGKTGAWSDPTQWDTGLPGAGDTANFGATGTFTVDFATTSTLSGLSGFSSAATLDLASGLLTLTGSLGNSGWSGLVTQSGGTLVQQSATFVVGGTLNETGGAETIELGAKLILNGQATISGELAGAGTLAIGGTVTLGANATIAGAVHQQRSAERRARQCDLGDVVPMTTCTRSAAEPLLQEMW